MLTNTKRVYALANFTVELRGKGWYFWRTYDRRCIRPREGWRIQLDRRGREVTRSIGHLTLPETAASVVCRKGQVVQSLFLPFPLSDLSRRPSSRRVRAKRSREGVPAFCMMPINTFCTIHIKVEGEAGPFNCVAAKATASRSKDKTS